MTTWCNKKRCSYSNKSKRCYDPFWPHCQKRSKMHDEMNRKTAHDIAQNQALHKEAQDVLEERIFTALQIAEKRGEIIANNQRAVQDVISWSQALLTALNVGDIEKDSLIHRKLREVIMKWRDDVERKDT